MKTEITLTIDPTDVNQVAAALALFQKLSGTAATATTIAETKVTTKERAKKADKVTEPKEEPVESETITENNGEEIKIEEVRALLSQKVGAHREAIKSTLTALGAPNVSTLDPAKYLEFKNFLTALS